ncbi:hypothetical protein GBW32_28930 [Streptomyces tsukubensis]|nr:hypothetical protein GBW32_28930 [Streptomyces tsukubensis]
MAKDGLTSSSRPSALDLLRSEIRLQRWPLWSWTAFVVVVAGFLLWLRGPAADAVRHAFDAYGYHGVQQLAWKTGQLHTPFSSAFNDLFYDPATLISLASFCVALFAAGPLTGREMESGAVRLAWSQSVSPARWLAARLALPALALTVGTGLLVVLYRLLWSANSGLLVAGFTPRRLYFSMGPATVAVPLLALAVGALCGLLLRRTLPAMLAAGVVQYLITSVHSGLWPFQRFYPVPELDVRSSAITSTGAHIPDPQCLDSTRCLAQHDVVGFTRSALPSSDYWPHQLAETGILLAVAALLAGFAFWALRRRTV